MLRIILVEHDDDNEDTNQVAQELAKHVYLHFGGK